MVVHDTPEAVRRIMPVLRGFDHPVRHLRLEVYVVRASRRRGVAAGAALGPAGGADQRLREPLAYDVYEMQAQAQLGGTEGQIVTYELGPEYKVSFRFGTYGGSAGQAAGLLVSRRAEGRPGRPAGDEPGPLARPYSSLGLAKSEASREAPCWC